MPASSKSRAEARARCVGPGDVDAVYTIGDGEMAAGSTLGAPKIVVTIKATGAIENIYSVAAGQVLVGTVLLHHWDARSGVRLEALPGEFSLYPERQAHEFALADGVTVREEIFALSGDPVEDAPPAAYYTVRLQNDGREAVALDSYAICQLRGEMPHGVSVAYDGERHAFVASNPQHMPEHVRIVGLSCEPTSYEVSADHAKAISPSDPGALSGASGETLGDPLGVFHLRSHLAPGESREFALQFTFSISGRSDAEATYDAGPGARQALATTRDYYAQMLGRAVVVTPDAVVNRGVLWAKANMLRTMLHSPTGWSFVNDPTRSNNSVGRDTAWFAFGADYLWPQFARESLLAYVERQEPSGMIVEYYDIRNGKTADYGLNINDNTPLLVLALWHHYNATGDREFLERVFPCAERAMRYALSQRDERGLIWCTSTKTSDWGIVGWRNVIADYSISGATTELNSECYAALQNLGQMARVLGKHDVSAEMANEATTLRTAINTHLANPENGLYYLNIEVDGTRRTDLTCDLVFPVMFGVADEATAQRIVARLSRHDFWTAAGMRTVPRDAPEYGPTHGYGLLGGVWVGVTFWFAFAAARFNTTFMAEALAASFRHYSIDPGKNNTVPGQFSEWLHGETLVNEGMMLSPWFPPRYLWAAIEGAAGLDVSAGLPRVSPRLAPDWKWLGVRHLPYRGRYLTWFVARTPELRLYTDFQFDQATPYITYEEDISERVRAQGHAVTTIGLRKNADYVLFVGSTVDRTVTTAVSLDGELAGSYRLRTFDSLRNGWTDGGAVDAARLRAGIPLEIERNGFWLLELEQLT
ncbi:MAG: hypothetical protein NVS3B16_09900 [Vulcanimicrobiaceae bacterium]